MDRVLKKKKWMFQWFILFGTHLLLYCFFHTSIPISQVFQPSHAIRIDDTSTLFSASWQSKGAIKSNYAFETKPNKTAFSGTATLFSFRGRCFTIITACGEILEYYSIEINSAHKHFITRFSLLLKKNNKIQIIFQGGQPIIVELKQIPSKDLRLAFY